MKEKKMFLTLFITTVICSLIVLTVIGGIASFEVASWLGVAYIFGILLLIVNVVIRSIVFLRPDQMMIHLLLGGIYYRTTVTRAYVEQAAYREWLRRVNAEDEPHDDRPLRSDMVRVGSLGIENLAIIPWPFVRGIIFPTTAVDLPIHVDDLFTKEESSDANIKERAHRTLLRMKIVVTIRFSPYVINTLQALSIADLPINDFSQVCTIVDNAGHSYDNVALLVREILPIVQPTFMEAVRTAATKFTWLGKRDINDKRTDLERETRKVICQRESALVHGGIFKPSNGRRGINDTHFGEAVLSVDVLFERLTFQPVTPEASELEKAINRPTIALLEAKSEAAKRRGEGEGIKDKATASGLEPADVLNAQVFEKVQNVQLISAGQRIVELISNLVGKSTGGN